MNIAQIMYMTIDFQGHIWFFIIEVKKTKEGVVFGQ